MIFSHAVLLLLTLNVFLGFAWLYSKIFRVQEIPGVQHWAPQGNSIYAGNSTVVNANPEYTNNDYGNNAGEWFKLSK